MSARSLDGHSPTARGIALSDDDRMRGWVIERLMCEFAFSRRELTDRFGSSADAIIVEAERLAGNDNHSLLERRGELFLIAPERQPLVRSIAAKFDSYFATGSARHSAAV